VQLTSEGEDLLRFRASATRARQLPACTAEGAPNTPESHSKPDMRIPECYVFGTSYVDICKCITESIMSDSAISHAGLWSRQSNCCRSPADAKRQ